METGQYSQPRSSNGNGNSGGIPISKSLPPKIVETRDIASNRENAEEDLNLRRLLMIVQRRFFVIASVTIAAVSAISFWSYTRTPKYEGLFQLLVEPVTAEKKLAKMAQAPSTSADGQDSLDYETQIQVLRSPELMAPIIKQLQTKYPDISYDSLIGGNTLTITRLKETKILEIHYRDPDAQKVKFVLHEVAKGYLRYSFNERQANVNKGIQFVDGQLPNLYTRVDKLQGQLQTFRQQYNLLDPEVQGQQISVRAGQVEQQQVETNTRLYETRKLYTTLQRQLGLAQNQAIAAANLSEAPRYQQLLNQMKEVETKIALESARFTETSPTIQALRDQQRNLQPLLRQEALRVLGSTVSQARGATDSPSSIRLALTKQMVDAANEMQVLKVRAEANAYTQQQIGQQVRLLPVIARQYTDLQRELKVGTESLNRFLAVRESLQIEAAQKALPWQLIMRPKQGIIAPSNERNIILGTIAGFLLGMGAAVLVERLDNVFHSPEELKDSTGLPLLGVVPFNKQLKHLKPVAQMASLITAEGSDRTDAPSYNPEEDVPVYRQSDRKRQPQWYSASPFLEAFRSLHTSISFLGSDTPIQSIVISSAAPGDGKSTVAVHLAQAATAMGQRVLLVDADLRRPQVHKVLGLPNHQGLSNVIATGLNPKQAIQRLPMWDHLYVLTAGQIPPDPTRLLCSKKMQHLMEQFHAIFDLVIYDTPPLLGLADSKLLAAHTQGIILVAGLGRTDRSLLMQALDGLKISSSSILGIVANGLKRYTTGLPYYYQRYYAQESEVEKAKKLLQNKLGVRK